MAAPIPLADGPAVIGSMWPMFNDLPRFLCAQRDKHGPVFRVRAANKQFVVLADAEAVAFVGSREGKDVLESRPSWVGMIAEYGTDRALVSEDGDLHAQFREMMRRGYAPQSLDGRYERVVQIIDAWIDRHLRPGAPMSAVARLQELMIDEISIAIADQLLFDSIDHIRTQVHWSTNVHLLKRWPALMLRLPKYRNAKALLMADAKRITDIFMQRSGTDAATGSGARLFDDLIEANKRRPDLMTDHDLPMNLFGPFLGGMDTASNTVASVLYTLAQHPDVLARAQREADALYDTGDAVDARALADRAPYFDALVKETMRLYPSVPALMRHARKDFAFHGHSIARGEQVMIATCVPQMSDEYFSNPFTFNPGRFCGDNPTPLGPGVYSPFGRGHHMCIGKRIAEILIPLTVSRIVYRTEYAMADPKYRLRGRFAYGVDLALNMKVRGNAQRHSAAAQPAARRIRA